MCISLPNEKLCAFWESRQCCTICTGYGAATHRATKGTFSLPYRPALITLQDISFEVYALKVVLLSDNCSYILPGCDKNNCVMWLYLVSKVVFYRMGIMETLVQWQITMFFRPDKHSGDRNFQRCPSRNSATRHLWAYNKVARALYIISELSQIYRKIENFYLKLAIRRERKKY